MTDHHDRFSWYELITTDVGAAAAFYGKVIGWETRAAVTPHRTHAVFTAGTSPVAGITHSRPDTGGMPMWLGYVGVADLDLTLARVSRLGGAVRVAPTDVPGHSRFSLITDPQMAMLALIEWRGPRPPPCVTGRRRVCWHELLAADCTAALDFYGTIFDWQTAKDDSGSARAYHLLSVGGQVTGGMFTKAPAVRVPHWLYYFDIADIDTAAERVTSGGGHVLGRPDEIGGGRWMTRCLDPQGAAFALVGERRRGCSLGYFARRPRR